MKENSSDCLQYLEETNKRVEVKMCSHVLVFRLSPTGGSSVGLRHSASFQKLHFELKMKDAGGEKMHAFRQVFCKESQIGWGSGKVKEICSGKITHSAAAI